MIICIVVLSSTVPCQARYGKPARSPPPPPPPSIFSFLSLSHLSILMLFLQEKIRQTFALLIISLDIFFRNNAGPNVCPACVCCTPAPPGVCCGCCAFPVEDPPPPPAVVTTP